MDVDATALLQNDARGVLVSLINDFDGFYGPFVLAPSTTRAPSLRDARRARTSGRPPSTASPETSAAQRGKEDEQGGCRTALSALDPTV